MPFSFRCVSDAKADLEVSAADEFYYYGVGNPKLTNALVRVLNPFTSAEVTRGNTGSTGVVTLHRPCGRTLHPGSQRGQTSHLSQHGQFAGRRDEQGTGLPVAPGGHLRLDGRAG